jgi:uncharacterized membrane protein
MKNRNKVSVAIAFVFVVFAVMLSGFSGERNWLLLSLSSIIVILVGMEDEEAEK